MRLRFFVGLVVVALAMALTKAWMSQPRAQEPAGSSGGVTYDALFPKEADQVLQWRAQQSPPASSPQR
jgi:hypothetical protein